MLDLEAPQTQAWTQTFSMRNSALLTATKQTPVFHLVPAGGSSCSWTLGTRADKRGPARHVGTQQIRVAPVPVRHRQSRHYTGE